MDNNQNVRLQKYLADCGIASRRKAEEMILHNKIMVNQLVINQLGYKIDPQKDVVSIDGKVIAPQGKKEYIMLNKPVGYITTAKDQFDRPTVLDLIDINQRIYPVGRLDYDTSGLLILTNDGELANKIMHPKFKINKTYIAKIDGIPDHIQLDRLRKGVQIEDYKTAPAELEVIKVSGKSSTVKIAIHEGRNRQVRKMFKVMGFRVIELTRVSLGKIFLGNLREGDWRKLKPDEINYLKSL